MLDSQKERFTQLLLVGQSHLDAYCEVYELQPDETRASPAVHKRAQYLARHPEVRTRLDQLRAPVIKAAQKQAGFTVDQAMQKINDVYEYAELLAEPNTMLKAIELQAKLHKLLVDVKEVRRDLLDEHTTEDLVMLLGELKRRRDAEVIDVTGVALLDDEGVEGQPLSVDCSHLL